MRSLTILLFIGTFALAVTAASVSVSASASTGPSTPAGAVSAPTSTGPSTPAGTVSTPTSTPKQTGSAPTSAPPTPALPTSAPPTSAPPTSTPKQTGSAPTSAPPTPALPTSTPKQTGSASTPASPTSTEIGKNNLFNRISVDGVASNRACDISDLPCTNGTQFKQGQSCSSTQQGEIPAIDKMVSTIIIEPANGQQLQVNKSFDIKVRTMNMNLGFFSDPETQYYAFSQQLDKHGLIMGHQHVTIQKIDDASQPMNPNAKVFFKGLNEATNTGDLSVNVPDGLPAGNYRLCTLSGSFAHQPVIMPIAQRGAQDDCIRFSVALGGSHLPLI